MAKQTSLLTFTGKLGNMIGYYRNGRHFVRSMPTITRQTRATRQAAQRFGIASSKGALIRKAFCRELDIPMDSSYINQLTKALIHAGNKDLGKITGFRFNQQTGTDKFFSIPPSLTAADVLHLPAQWLGQHNGATALEIKVIATRISFATQQVKNTEVSQLIIDTSTYFTGADLLINAPGKGILIVVVQVRAIIHGRPSTDRKYSAADIIAVGIPAMKHISYPPLPSYPALSCNTSVQVGYKQPTPITRQIIQRE
ncbi:hypothetical protein [Chitinophaga rhizophila]|uniref:Uncharacterized protein n=1 Tax=Chitinophaga rhizophila TaxID=2866212 RepID=A0ABS7GG25_9BACT|nr:hypothetical protein [Chitinophaga rhizophila]MBW8686644.1 hypothetical protein [Chitinophaga rhizophila]